MARSRKSVEALIGEALAALAEPPTEDRPFAVAYSGGLDSTVLLHGAARALGASRVLALHVHHGLQPQADAWGARAADRAAALGVRFRLLRAADSPARGDSIERWARSVRYALLGEAARAAGACALATAHHADDQLETLLLALSRGCGLDGLTGIAACDRRAGVLLLRPLLPLDREALLADARVRGLDWVEDPSNADPAVARSAVRHRLMPTLHAVLPGLAGQVSGALEALRDARSIVEGRAGEDLAAARRDDPPGSLDRRTLAALPAPRGDAALRAWIRGLGEPPPSRAKLAEMRAQLLADEGGAGTVGHGRQSLHRYRDRLWAEDAQTSAAASDEETVCWTGQSPLVLPAGGRLWIESSPDGLDPAWLRGQRLRVGPAPSSARWRPDPSRPSRTLKNLRQEAGVPPALRSRLPTVWAAGRLLWAAPFGLDHDPRWPRSAEGVAFAWEPADPAMRAWFAATLSGASSTRWAGRRSARARPRC